MAGVAKAATAPSRQPLAAMLSQLLVALTIEFDNEFEHRIEHRTTRHGSTAASDRAVWLVSMPMWVHCMRHVPKDGILAGELVDRMGLDTSSAKALVRRMSKWWGYLVVDPNRGDSSPKPPARWLVRPSRAGRKAQLTWEPLTGVIEGRWNARFGDERIDQLKLALWEVVRQIDVETPDYIPFGKPRLRLRSSPKSAEAAAELSLPALMSKVLLAFALDFEGESDLSLGIYTADGVSRLAISANVLRVLDRGAVRIADIPALTGVAKMAIDNWVRSLDTHGYLVVGTDPDGSRFRVARLTAKGRAAKDTYVGWAATVQHRWEKRFGTDAVRALAHSLEPLVMGTAAHALLLQGMTPYPDGWRAQVRAREVLPHYPVVSHRGGFPDGS